MSPWHSGSLLTVDSSIRGLDFIKTKGYWWSNLGRWSRRGWLRRGWWGGGAPQPRHRFRWGLTLWTQRIKGNSPRGSSNGGGNRSRVRDGGWLAPTISDVDNELQRSADNEIRLRGGGTTCRRATWCWLGVAGSPMERRRARMVARVSIFADWNSL
jgi:hypothetical protein